MSSRSTTAALLAVIGGCLILSRPAGATVLTPLGFPELMSRADRVFVGRVTDVRSAWSSDGSSIMTYVTLLPSDHVKGAVTPDPIVIERVGGRVGDLAEEIVGSPQFEAGETALVFARRIAAGAYRTVGLKQGKFAVRNGVISRNGRRLGEVLRALRDLARGHPISLSTGSPAAEPTVGPTYLAGPTWATPTATWYVNTGGSGLGASATTAVTLAFLAWDNVSRSAFSFVSGGATANSGANYGDGQSVVSWTALPAGNEGAIAITAIWTSSGHIVQCDTVFDVTLPWATSGSSTAYDVQDIAAHEFGHWIELEDLYASGDSWKTMYGYGSLGETYKRTLHRDDMDGIAYLYPASISVSYIGASPASVVVGNTATVQVAVTNTGSYPIYNLWLGLGIWSPAGVKVESIKAPVADAETGRIGLIDFGSAQGLTLAPSATRIFVANYTFSQSVTGHQYAPGAYQYRFVAWADGYPGLVTEDGLQIPSAVGGLQTTSLAVSAPAAPDYAVGALSRTDSGNREPGATIQVSGTTVNQGSGAASTASTTSVYLSADSTITTSDIRIYDDSVPALAASASDSWASIAMAIPVGTAPGNYYIGAIADRGGVISESNETNNTRATSTAVVTVTAPDSVAITSGPTGTPNPVDSAGSVSCSATATDSLGHAISYQWTCSGGTFADPNVQNATWRAPANKSGSTQQYSLTVTARCSQGKSAALSYPQGVTSLPNRAPVLSQGGFEPADPAAYNVATQFRFYVTYYDADGDVPAAIDVVIDGAPYPMDVGTLVSGIPYEAIYEYRTDALATGQHSYHFEGQDGSGGSARLPGAGELAGPFLCAVVVNDGAAWTTTPAVSARVYARGASQVYLKNKWADAWQGPFTYAPDTAVSIVIPWTLAAGAEGSRSVYAMCVTAAAQPSNVSSDTILFSTAPGTLSGTIKESGTNAPLAGATVKAYLAGVLKATATSDAGGGYRMTAVLPPGTYSVTAARAGYSTQTKTGIAVTPGAVSYCSFFLVPAGTLSGTIKDRGTNALIAGATVKAYLAGVLKATATSDANGGYRMTDALPGGTYSVTATKAGYGTQTKTSIAVTPGAVSYCSFSLIPAGTLSGTIKDRGTNAPIAGATVKAYLVGVLKATATSDATGGYRMTDALPEGTYSVTAAKAGYGTQTKTGIAVTPGAVSYCSFFLIAQ